MAKNVAPRKIKVSKIAIVMFLTVLIWVYADLALDDTHPVANVPISITKSGDSQWWATFRSEDGSPVSSIVIKLIVLKGPTSRIAEVKRELNNELLSLAFTLNPEALKMTSPGSHTLDVLDFLRKSEQIRGLGGLTVESCEPNTIGVEVVKLTRKDLDIRTVDESGRPLEYERITQPRVSMYVPENWGQDSAAEIMLSPVEIERARLTPVSKRPYVVLADGEKRLSNANVQVKLLPEEEELEQFTISRVVVGYLFSANTQGRYKVQMQPLDERELSNEIKIRATPAAKAAYDGQLYQVMVEIEDNDRSGDPVRRPLKYNLPEEYVRKNEIKLDPEHLPVEAKFKLVPLPSADNP